MTVCGNRRLLVHRVLEALVSKFHHWVLADSTAAKPVRPNEGRGKLTSRVINAVSTRWHGYLYTPAHTFDEDSCTVIAS